jgi:hypothetical protein
MEREKRERAPYTEKKKKKKGFFFYSLLRESKVGYIGALGLSGFLTLLYFDSGFLSELSLLVDVGLLSRTTYICVSSVIAYICYFVFFLFFASHGSWEIGFYFLTVLA